MKSQWYLPLIYPLLATATLPVQAAQLVSADFTGGISFVSATLGGGLGLQRTNTCSGCAAGTVAGNLIYDLDQKPGAGSGFVNVPLNAIAGSADDEVFAVALGSVPLAFKFGDANIQGGPAMQFNNGAFNGLFFVEDFIYNATPYELNVQGGSWTLYGQDNSGFYFANVASGYINTGDNNLLNQQPLPAVPLPAALPLLSAGLAGLALLKKRWR